MGRNRNRFVDRPSSPVRVAAPPASPIAPAPDVEPQQRFVVVIENKMSQPLEVSVLSESGDVVGVRLAPRGKSHPIPTDRVGQRTRDLAALGRVRIVPQS